MILRYTSPTVEFLIDVLADHSEYPSKKLILLDQNAISENTTFTAVTRRECCNVSDREYRCKSKELCCTREDLMYAGTSESVEYKITQILNAAGEC